MGSSPSYNVQMPATPTPPTASQTAEEYAKALPIYYQTALQYEPQMAALEKQINEQLYPSTASLQETLAGQASKGMTESLPSWYKSQVEDTLKSQFGGRLAYNPQAQEEYGLKTQQAYQNYGDYYRNLALSVANRQPLAQSANLMQTYTPQANMANSASGYGNYVGAYSSMYGTNAQMLNAQNNYTNPWANIGGSILGNAAGTMTGLGGLKLAKNWGLY